MKGTDIALIIFVALISTGISFWVGNMVLGNPDDRTETISYMDVITDSLNEPDNEYFNPKAKNPTVEVFIGKCESGMHWNEVLQLCDDGEGNTSDPIDDDDDDEDEDEDENNENQNNQNNQNNTGD